MPNYNYMCGQKVKIIDSRSPFYLKIGKVSRSWKSDNVQENHCMVKLNDTPISVVCAERQLVAEEEEKIDNELMANNLYRRYMYIRLEAMSDVLDFLREPISIEDAADTIREYMHKNSKRCFDNQLSILSLLPDKDKAKYNDLVAAGNSGRGPYAW